MTLAADEFIRRFMLPRTKGLSPHPPLWAVCQHGPRRQHRAAAPVARLDDDICRESFETQSRAARQRQFFRLPLLRRTHDRHRFFEHGMQPRYRQPSVAIIRIDSVRVGTRRRNAQCRLALPVALKPQSLPFASAWPPVARITPGGCRSWLLPNRTLRQSPAPALLRSQKRMRH